LELTIGKAEILLDKIVENQSWFQDKAQHCHQTEEILEGVNALSTKMEAVAEPPKCLGPPTPVIVLRTSDGDAGDPPTLEVR